MPISERERLEAIENKLSQAQRLITQAFSIIQYINVPDGRTDDSSTTYYPGQYRSPKTVQEDVDGGELTAEECQS